MNSIQEIRYLADYLEGYSDAIQNPGAEKIHRAACWLKKLQCNVCGAGVIGCRGGEKCTSDHK